MKDARLKVPGWSTVLVDILFSNYTLYTISTINLVTVVYVKVGPIDKPPARQTAKRQSGFIALPNDSDLLESTRYKESWDSLRPPFSRLLVFLLLW